MAIHGGDIYNNTIAYDFSVNLNPFKIPDSITKALSESLLRANVYPDINQDKVRSSLAKIDNIDADMVLAGNGASELIMAVTKALYEKKKGQKFTVLLASPCFYGYTHALNSLKDCCIKEYNLCQDNNFLIDDNYINLIDSSVDAVYIADPGNPTGKNISEDMLDKILNKAGECNVTVVLDESFFFLSDKYSDSLCSDNQYVTKLLNNNSLYIIRSFTKLFALPGVRAGYIIGNSQGIKAVRKHLPEWNLSVMAEMVLIEGAGLITDKKFVEQSCRYIKRERSILEKELSKAGIKVFESDTVFLLVKSHENLYEKLLSEGILIRDCSNFNGLTNGFYRIAVKDAKDNQLLLGTVQKLLKA